MTVGREKMTEISREAALASFFVRPGRTALIAGVMLGVAGLAVGVASLIFDLGWVLWILALAAFGVAVLCGLSGTRPSALVGLVAAGAIVIGGIFAAGAAPPLPKDWTVLPAFAPHDDDDDEVYEVGRDDDVIVMIDRAKDALIGYALDGDPLWTNEEANAGGHRDAVFAGASVLTYPDDDRGSAISVSTASGETEWSTEVAGAAPFSDNDDVIVFAGDDSTFALDRQTGAHVWELAADVTANSEGASGFDPSRWTSNVDWLVVRDPEPGQYQVVDSRTGESVAKFGNDETLVDWAIAGDTLFTFDYDDSGRRIVVGTPLDGGEGWTTQVDELNGGVTYEPVGADLRMLGRSSVQWLEGETGELTTFQLPTGWSFTRMWNGIDGARSLAAESRDSDDELVGVGVFDSRTGDLTEVDGSFAKEPAVEGVTPTGTLVSLPYLDAVGGKHDRTVLVADPE